MLSVRLFKLFDEFFVEILHRLKPRSKLLHGCGRSSGQGRVSAGANPASGRSATPRSTKRRQRRPMPIASDAAGCNCGHQSRDGPGWSFPEAACERAYRSINRHSNARRDLRKTVQGDSLSGPRVERTSSLSALIDVQHERFFGQQKSRHSRTLACASPGLFGTDRSRPSFRACGDARAAAARRFAALIERDCRKTRRPDSRLAESSSAFGRFDPSHGLVAHCVDRNEEITVDRPLAWSRGGTEPKVVDLHERDQIAERVVLIVRNWLKASVVSGTFKQPDHARERL